MNTKENVPPGRLIIIEGNISAGKSTLSRELGAMLGYELCSLCFSIVWQPTLNNPYLEKFYDDMKKWALPMQLWLIRQRFKSYIKSIKLLLETGKGVILDRSVYSDIVFADKNMEDGNITRSGYDYYLALRHKMLGELPVPHVTIYLDVSPQECYDRIHNVRGRECEQVIPLEYLEGLDRCYKNFVEMMAQMGSAVILVPWQHFGNSEEVVNRIKSSSQIDLHTWAGNLQMLYVLVRSTKRLKDMMKLHFRLDGVEDDESGTEWDGGVADRCLDGEEPGEAEEMAYDNMLNASVSLLESSSEDTILMDVTSLPGSPALSLSSPSYKSPGYRRFFTPSPPTLASTPLRELMDIRKEGLSGPMANEESLSPDLGGDIDIGIHI